MFKIFTKLFELKQKFEALIVHGLLDNLANDEKVLGYKIWPVVGKRQYAICGVEYETLIMIGTSPYLLYLAWRKAFDDFVFNKSTSPESYLFWRVKPELSTDEHGYYRIRGRLCFETEEIIADKRRWLSGGK